MSVPIHILSICAVSPHEIVEMCNKWLGVGQSRQSLAPGPERHFSCNLQCMTAQKFTQLFTHSLSSMICSCFHPFIYLCIQAYTLTHPPTQWFTHSIYPLPHSFAEGPAGIMHQSTVNHSCNSQTVSQLCKPTTLQPELSSNSCTGACGRLTFLGYWVIIGFRV